jgi:branched-chain amino acid aminotransferase group I
MSDRDGKIWMDGQLVEWRDAKIHVLTHTLHYGCGAFEGVRAYETAQGTAIFRLEEHTKRLFNSAKILRMQIPFSQEQVNQAQVEVVKANGLKSCYLRPLTWIGDRKLGVSPKGNTIHLMVAAWAWGAYLGEEGMQRGIRTKISSYTRHHVNITMSQAKAVSNYTNSILANTEALDDGYDEAILLDASGFVSEGSGENIFVIKDGVIYTPTCPPAHSTASRATPCCTSARTWAWKWCKSASPAMSCTSRTSCSSPAPPQKSRPSAKWTACRSAKAAAARSPRKSRRPTLTSSTAATPNTHTG